MTLVEIPTGSEFFDNIVAYWQPAHPIPAGSEYSFSYRASSGDEPPDHAAVWVKATRSGQKQSDHPIPVRQFMIDFWDPKLSSEASYPNLTAILPSSQVSSSAGSVDGLLVQALPDASGWRVGFQLDPGARRRRISG
jgi:glucans biosynthesis protein